MSKKNTADLTHGPVLRQLITLVIPLFITNLVQQLFSTADLLIVGNFSTDSETVLAAVSSSANLSSLLITLVLAMAVGNNVLCANLVGAGATVELRRVMHTSLLVALLLGIVFVGVGLPLAPAILRLIHCPEEILDAASLYIRLFFVGQIPLTIFNFGAGILRAHGDTRRPMNILLGSGALKALLNLLFVAVFKLDVLGVGLATIISNAAAALVVLFILFSPHGDFRLSLAELRLSPKESFRIMRVGLPMGINDTLFNLSSVLVQNSINQFGATVVAGDGVASNLTAFIYVFFNSFHHALVSFAGQNYGAKKFGRIREAMWKTIAALLLILVVLALFITFFPTALLSIYAEDAAVVQAGVPRLIVFAWGFLINVFPTLSSSCLFGMGRTGSCSFVNMLCNLIPRYLWIVLLFPHFSNLWFLLLCYPASWCINTAANAVFLSLTFRKEQKKLLQ
ncbi:MAG: MATE family efflux transporter [Clostridia bacterium]|nr:MATE family efflux transporter [Clostridia bacterium]